MHVNVLAQVRMDVLMSVIRIGDMRMVVRMAVVRIGKVRMAVLMRLAPIDQADEVLEKLVAQMNEDG